MNRDPLYFPRQKLAMIMLESLKEGITHAFTLFAPRRMGKTQFLLNDIAPAAQEMGFNVFYFSFMDDNGDTIAERFQTALYRFAKEASHAKSAKTFIGSLSKIEILGVGIEREPVAETIPPISDVIGVIAAAARPTVLLLDEVQELARVKHTEGLIRALRTGLDVNQGRIKTIFTGSSTNGLRAMFNNSKAPFFHFAHALDFPLLGKDFTDFLADIYEQRTGKVLDKEDFYQIFEQFNHTPLYMRAMTQDMIIDPELSLEAAAKIRWEQMHESSGHLLQWNSLGVLERLVLHLVVQGQTALYGAETRVLIADKLGVDEVSAATVQGAVRKLERKDLMTRDSGNTLQINSPLFQAWIVAHTKDE